MKKLTAKEILEIIEQNYEESSFAYNEWSECDFGNSDEFEHMGYEEREDAILQKLGLGEVEEVEQYGGEGKGETWYSVKYFKDHDVYIRIDGFYASYDGTSFYDGYGCEVRPTQKTITVYE